MSEIALCNTPSTPARTVDHTSMMNTMKSGILQLEINFNSLKNDFPDKMFHVPQQYGLSNLFMNGLREVDVWNAHEFVSSSVKFCHEFNKINQSSKQLPAVNEWMSKRYNPEFFLQKFCFILGELIEYTQFMRTICQEKTSADKFNRFLQEKKLKKCVEILRGNVQLYSDAKLMKSLTDEFVRKLGYVFE